MTITKKVSLTLGVSVACIGSICAVYAKVQAGKDKIPFKESESYRVTHALDGDTFTISLGENTSHRQVTIRMLGINTPETVDPRKPPECFGKEASDETKSALSHSLVRLKLNPNREAQDKYGRYLAYVYKDKLFVNEYLLEQGFAREYTYGKPYSMQNDFKKIESQAKRNKKGLWGECKY